MPAAPRCRVVALISGRGSNLQALLDAAARGDLPLEMAAVISNRPDAQGLQRATQAQVPAHCVDHNAYPERDAFEQALAQTIDAGNPDLVILAGFMRVLGDDLVERYAGRMLNIHPSLLPKFRGLNSHRRALEAGEREHGASVHFVTRELDGGPLIAQARVAMHPGDSEAGLAARVLEQEHRLYPLVVGWFAQGRLALRDNRVYLDGLPLEQVPVFGVGE